MKQPLMFAFAATLATTAVAATTQVIAPEMGSSADVITIEVAPEELARCQETLAQVASMPVTTDRGTPLPVSADDDLPRVACVAVEA